VNTYDAHKDRQAVDRLHQVLALCDDPYTYLRRPHASMPILRQMLMMMPRGNVYIYSNNFVSDSLQLCRCPTSASTPTLGPQNLTHHPIGELPEASPETSRSCELASLYATPNVTRVSLQGDCVAARRAPPRPGPLLKNHASRSSSSKAVSTRASRPRPTPPIQIEPHCLAPDTGSSSCDRLLALCHAHRPPPTRCGLGLATLYCDS